MGFYIELSQSQLCSEFGVNIRNELVTKYAALKIAFPKDRFDALNAINMGNVEGEYTVKNFTDLCQEKLVNLSKVGITSDKIKKIALLSNYYAENHYLGKAKDNEKESELKELASQGIEFTIMASSRDADRVKNLPFNHRWQRDSDGWKY